MKNKLKGKVKEMAIFEKTYNAINDMNSAIEAARETFQSAKKEILATFKSPASETKLSEVKAVYESAVADQRKKAREAVAADVAEARRKVNEIVSAAAPADFPTTLAALQSKGERISDYESRAFLDKYKGNYLAFSTLADVLHGVNKAGDVLTVKPDEVAEVIDSVERAALNFIQKATYGDYMTALFTSEEHSPILKSGAAVQAFLDGGFTVADDSEELAAAIARMNS